MIDILTNKKLVSIKPVIKGHHLYHVFCDLITMPRYRRNFCSRQSTVNSLWTMKETNLFVCKLNITHLVTYYRRKDLFPPPPIFSTGVYKRLVFCQKLPPKSQFLASKLGGGRLLEHGRLLEILRYSLCLFQDKDGLF